MKLRVAVAEDEPRLLQTITSILEQEFDVIATFSEGRSLLEFVCEKKPDVAVVDLGLPDTNGLEVVRQIKKLGIGTKVVICSVETDQDLVDAAFSDDEQVGYVLQRSASKLTPQLEIIHDEHTYTSHFGPPNEWILGTDWHCCKRQKASRKDYRRNTVERVDAIASF